MYKNLISNDVMMKFVNGMNYSQKFLLCYSVVQFRGSKDFASEVNCIVLLVLFLSKHSS
jgi:hypothetical protein